MNRDTETTTALSAFFSCLCAFQNFPKHSTERTFDASLSCKWRWRARTITKTSNKDAALPPLSAPETTPRPADAAWTFARGTERQNIAGMWLSASSAKAQKEDTTGGSMSPIRDDPGQGRASAVGAGLWLKIIAVSRISSNARTSAPPAALINKARDTQRRQPSTAVMSTTEKVETLATIVLVVE